MPKVAGLMLEEITDLAQDLKVPEDAEVRDDQGREVWSTSPSTDSSRLCANLGNGRLTPLTWQQLREYAGMSRIVPVWLMTEPARPVLGIRLTRTEEGAVLMLCPYPAPA